MDESVDPCNNFYEYACGTWVKREALSPTEQKKDTFTIVEDDVNLHLRYLLEEKVGPDDPAYKAQPRNFYKGCMNLARIAERGEKPFLEFLATVGEFPALDPDWNETQSDFSLEDTIVRLAKLDLLEEKVGPDDPAYKAQPRNFYKGCMNLGRIAERGEKPFLEFLATVGEFPALDPEWNETQSDFSLEDTIVRLAKLGETPLFSIKIDRDVKNPEANRLYMGDAVLSVQSQGYYTVKDAADTPIFQQRKKWLVDTLVLLGADQDTAESDVASIINFEIALANSMRDPVEKENEQSKYNPTNPKQLKVEYPYLNWLKVFQGIGSNPDGGSVLIDDDERIINQELDYFEKLGLLLQDTDKRVVANYLMSNLLKYTAWLGTEFTNIYDIYRKDTMDVSGSERWKLCIKQATTIFPEAVSRLFIEEHFKKDAKDKVDDMVADLRKAFKDLIISNIWMSVETKQKAEEKLNRMSTKVGYPEYIMDDERINDLYADIPTDDYNYLETMVAHRKFQALQKLQNVRKKPDRQEWTRIFPASVESGYYHLANELTFPAAFLQPPLFSPEYPSSMNYAGAGMWFGRDLTQGFGVRGSRYDGDGYINPWWSDKDKEGYESQSTCFVDQYGCYKWEGNSIDGEMTLAENVADNGGLRQSYRAYRALIKRQGVEEQRLPGLDLNHNQIFFLSFAQTWCAKIRDEIKESIVEDGPHSPHPYRVYGALQNSKEFAEAFKCPAGSRMNPMRKCIMF
ncbi:endothelin-converting enzyme 1 [Elysia marginata]|uniref:Endothelin-converting enzyme 1 n=1 Tax=Elysia marginata TaxID=1093978 RepID=A0AAV4ESZ7_9GAST|nr:endothelin-converting enzyme 1 [Elysia marginata]